MQRKRAAEVAQEGAKNANNIRSGKQVGSPWAIHGAGRWNDGGWRRRGEEVNLLWSSCRRLSAVQHARRCGGFRGYAIIPPTPLGIPYVTLGDPLGIFWGLLWDALGTPWGPLGDPLGTSWGLLGPSGDSLGTIGNPLGTFGNPLGIPWGSSGTSWGSLESPRQPFGDHFGVLLDTLGTS